MTRMLAFLLALSVTISFTTPVAGEPKANALTITRAWCVNEADARRLTSEMVLTGDAGYSAVMGDQNSTCFDYRMDGVDITPVELLELAWTATHKDGRVFDFWLVRDTNHTKAYVWILVEGEAA